MNTLRPMKTMLKTIKAKKGKEKEKQKLLKLTFVITPGAHIGHSHHRVGNVYVV